MLPFWFLLLYFQFLAGLMRICSVVLDDDYGLMPTLVDDASLAACMKCLVLLFSLKHNIMMKII